MDTFYIELLKKTHDTPYHLSKSLEFNPTGILLEAIGDFLSNRKKGIHVAIICADVNFSTSILDPIEFSKLLKEKSGRQEEPILIQLDKVLYPNNQNTCYCYVGQESGIAGALNVIYKCAQNVIGKANLLETAEGAIEFYPKFESIFSDAPENIWTQSYIEKFSPLWDPIGSGADIRILIFLPESSFEIFRIDTFWFPVEIEYVVLGTSDFSKSFDDRRKKEIYEVFICKIYKELKVHIDEKPGRNDDFIYKIYKELEALMTEKPGKQGNWVINDDLLKNIVLEPRYGKHSVSGKAVNQQPNMELSLNNNQQIIDYQGMADNMAKKEEQGKSESIHSTDYKSKIDDEVR